MKTLNLKSGETVNVYKSKNRDTLINANDCTTEYNASGEILYDKNNRPPKS